MSTSNQPPAQHQPYPLPVPGPAPVKTGKRGNGLGIAALIVGGFALIGAFIPILNYIAGFVGLVGLVLGIVALCLKNRKKGFAVAGTIVSAIAIVLSIILAITYTAGFAGLVSDAVKTAKAESSAAANKEISVIYEVNGTATDASITYSTYSAGSSSTEQASGKSLPFIQELTVQAGSEYDYASYSLQAQNGAEDTGSVSCKITVDGDVVAEQTATGAYAMGHAPRRVPTGCRRTSRRLLPSSLERACFDGRHREALDLTSWRIRTATRSLASAEAG